MSTPSPDNTPFCPLLVAGWLGNQLVHKALAERNKEWTVRAEKSHSAHQELTAGLEALVAVSACRGSECAAWDPEQTTPQRREVRRRRIPAASASVARPSAPGRLGGAAHEAPPTPTGRGSCGLSDGQLFDDPAAKR